MSEFFQVGPGADPASDSTYLPVPADASRVLRNCARETREPAVIYWATSRDKLARLVAGKEAGHRIEPGEQRTLTETVWLYCAQGTQAVLDPELAAEPRPAPPELFELASDSRPHLLNVEPGAPRVVHNPSGGTLIWGAEPYGEDGTIAAGQALTFQAPAYLRTLTGARVVVTPEQETQR